LSYTRKLQACGFAWTSALFRFIMFA